MTSAHVDRDPQVVESPKKPYAKPALQVYGRLMELTQTVTGTAALDNPTMSQTTRTSA